MHFIDIILAIGYTLNKVKKLINQAIVGSSTYKGTWNAATNTPTLTNGTGHKGDYYVVSVAGTFDGKTYTIGDTIKYNGSIWEQVETHVNSDIVESYTIRAETAATSAESYKNVATEKASQAENSATQAGTYATQSGNYASESMQARDEIEGLFVRCEDLVDYKAKAQAGIIKENTIAFIMQEGI